MVILNNEEKEQLIIKLAMEGLLTREIARLARASFKFIDTIIRKYNGEEIEYQNKTPSITSKAFQMFKDGKNRVEIAIALNLESYDIISLFQDYLKLSNLDNLVTTYDYLGNSLPTFLDLFDNVRKRRDCYSTGHYKVCSISWQTCKTGGRVIENMRTDRKIK